MSDDFTSRPQTKRVRSDHDHSKADTKQHEDDMKPDDEKKDKEKDGDHEDEDWLSQPPFSVGQSWDGWTTRWRESCWCGKTAFVFDSDPLQSKICHCEDCQRLHGAPFQHSAIFKKPNVRLDSDPEWLGFLSAHGEVHPLSKTPTPLPRKTSCRACGSPMFDEGNNMIMAFPPNFEFARTQSELDNFNKKTKGSGDDHSHGKGEEGGKQLGMPEVLKPGCHIFYERRVMDYIDGKTKWRKHKDTEEMGERERP